MESFSSHSAEVFRTGIFCCINVGYRKSLDKRGGVSRFSIENFSSHSAEIFRARIPYCCINFGNRKGLDRKGRQLQGIPSNIFCLTVPKNSIGESFTVALISGSEKVYGQEGGKSIKIFRRNFFVSQSQIFRGGILCCCSNVGYRKCLDKKRGVSRFSVENFLSHSAENLRRGIFHCYSNVGYRKSLDKRGQREYQDFPSKIFCLTVPNISVGESFTVALISVTEKFG